MCRLYYCTSCPPNALAREMYVNYPSKTNKSWKVFQFQIDFNCPDWLSKGMQRLENRRVYLQNCVHPKVVDPAAYKPQKYKKVTLSNTAHRKHLHSTGIKVQLH